MYGWIKISRFSIIDFNLGYGSFELWMLGMTVRNAERTVGAVPHRTTQDISFTPIVSSSYN